MRAVCAFRLLLLCLFSFSLGASCAADTVPPPLVYPEASTNLERDILHTDLEFDIAGRSGVARVTVAEDTSLGLSLNVGDLVINSVALDSVPLHYRREDKRLDIGVPETKTPPTITVEYSFQSHDGFEGFREQGSTLTWPTWCGNLFPCKTDPDDGATYSLNVRGAYPDGCNQIDILTDPLWSRIPYEKGAFFLRAVEGRIGRALLDASLASFYQANVGQAVHMQDLLDSITTQAQVDIDDLVQAWLKSKGIPE